MGCLTMGAGMNDTEASEPVYLDEAGGIGMFCVAYQAECIPATATEPGIFRWDDLNLIAKRIAEIKSLCRWCVIVSHGGKNSQVFQVPTPETATSSFWNSEPMWSSPIIPMSRKTTSSLTTEKQFSIHSETSFLIPTISVHLYTDVGVLLKLIFTEEAIDFEAIGIRIIRGDERIDIAPLPAIFTDIPAAEYELLAPLSAKAFVAEDRRKMIYLEPERFTDASEDVWNGISGANSVCRFESLRPQRLVQLYAHSSNESSSSSLREFEVGVSDDLAELAPHIVFTPYIRALAAELSKGCETPLEKPETFTTSSP